MSPKSNIGLSIFHESVHASWDAQHAKSDEWISAQKSDSTFVTQYGMEFPETGACFMDIWAREYGRSGDKVSQKALSTLLNLFISMRDPQTGAMSWCSSDKPTRRELSALSMNLNMASILQNASKYIEKRDPELCEKIRSFVREIDEEYLGYAWAEGCRLGPAP